MKAKDKVKMCPFCEGSVALDAMECRYCGSAFSRTPREGASKMASPYQTEDSLASLYQPPYAPKRTTAYASASLLDASDDLDDEPPPPRAKPAAKAASTAAAVASEELERSHIGSLLLLSIGSQLFTLGWLLFFFSSHGRLTLEWKSRYWILYLLLSLPCIYHGWKKR